MTAPLAAADLAIGTEFRSRLRAVTRERMRWYADALETAIADDGTVHAAPPNIHTDDAIAASQGLPAIIVEGMMSTNWLYGFLLDTFGPAFLDRGEFSTKFIRPVYEDQMLGCCARLREKVQQPDGAVRCDLEIWCEDDKGTVLTVGAAAVFLPS